MAKGWYGEPKRHAEAALRGKGSISTPVERQRQPKFTPPYEVGVWEERDRLGIWVTDADDRKVAEWWDDDARQMFEDGFFEGGPRLKHSVLEYLRERGVIPTVERLGLKLYE